MTSHATKLPVESIPHHVAIIMDGNGRWAQQRGQPRAMGHRAGVKSVRRVLQCANKAGVQVLTLYAFSQENWQRPAEEVRLLMQLFIKTLSREINKMRDNNIRIRFIGDHSGFDPLLRAEMIRAEALTAPNSVVTLVIAVGYGGQWDIVQAAQKLADKHEPITIESLEKHLDTADVPQPDLLIRTGGEKRISNFLLWQLAYSELYFCDTLWPDFNNKDFDAALTWFSGRQRRYGTVPDGG